MTTRHESSTAPRPTRSALARAATPWYVRFAARLLLLAFLATPFLLALVPWQQTVMCRGTVTAFSPTERMQVLTARVAGQIVNWHVVEGSRVKMNDPVVDIEDNDPALAQRLDEQRKFLTGRLEAAHKEVAELTAAAKAQESARDAAVKAAEANREAARKTIEVSQQTKANAQFAQTFERGRSDTFDGLFNNPKFGGLESRLSRDEARMRADRAQTDIDKADAEIQRAQAGLLTQEALLLQAEAAGLSAIAVARSNLRKAEQSLFSVEREIQDIDNRIERFKARNIVAPCDGTVYRVAANVGPGGQYVKEGDELCTIVPDTADRVVELFLDGIDAPLVLAYADRIKQAGVPVIVHPSMRRAGVGETENLSFETAATLRKAGIPVALQSGFEGYVPKTRVALFEAGIAAANGLEFEEALATITIDAARIIGVEDRVGSLQPGRDGDVAVFDGDPFEYTTHCTAVVVNGRVASTEPR